MGGIELRIEARILSEFGTCLPWITLSRGRYSCWVKVLRIMLVFVVWPSFWIITAIFE